MRKARKHRSEPEPAEAKGRVPRRIRRSNPKEYPGPYAKARLSREGQKPIL